MNRVVCALVLATACGGSRAGTSTPPLSDLGTLDSPDSRGLLARELEADIIDSYARDESLPPPARQLDPSVGGARIGVGPDELATGFEVVGQPRRWPLTLAAPDHGEVWSKKLEVHVAASGTAGWAVDELSWRITACGRKVVVPLRYTGLFAREGDRWMPVVEHLSYAVMPGRSIRGPGSAPIEPALGQRALTLALDAAAAPLWASRRPIEATIGIDTLALGPDLWNELRGDQVRTTPLLAGAADVVTRRAGALEARGATTTVAYWVGTLRLGAGTPLLRGTLVFERTDRWRVVQAHVSAPISDDALAAEVFGSALVTAEPLALDCAALTGAAAP